MALLVTLATRCESAFTCYWPRVGFDRCDVWGIIGTTSSWWNDGTDGGQDGEGNMSLYDFENCISVFLCLLFAPASFPYDVVHSCQLKSMSADNQALDNLIRDENLGSVGLDNGWAKLFKCRFTTPLNESGLQAVLGL